MLDGRKEYSLENVRLRITRMALMLDGRKAHSLENRRLRITRMARMLDGRKEYSLENVRLRITRMVLMLGMKKEHSLENTRLRITRMERMWATRILVWGYLGDYAPPCGGGDGGGASSRWLVEGLPFSVLYSFYTLSWHYLASFSLYIHNGKGCSKIGWT